MADQHNHDIDDPYFYIADEEGNEERFEILYEFDVDETGYHYLLLIPADQSEEEEVDVYPIKYKLVDEEPNFETIEDDEEWEMIEEVINTLESLELEEEEQA